MVKWQHSIVSVDSLTPYDKNPRTIGGKQLDDLRASVDKFGLAEPIVANKDGVIIGGHARYMVATERGEGEVPVYMSDRHLSEDELKELNIRLNKNIAGEWDFSVLGAEFEFDSLVEWGFDAEVLEKNCGS